MAILRHRNCKGLCNHWRCALLQAQVPNIARQRMGRPDASVEAKASFLRRLQRSHLQAGQCLLTLPIISKLTVTSICPARRCLYHAYLGTTA
eukprot:scaffold128892_cov21-Prasinocladus_malaysianus.AAC.1